MRKDAFSRRGFSALLAGGALWPASGLATVLEFTKATRLPDREDEVYQPPTKLATVADIYRRMTAAVSVNGAGPFRFVVDTGANQSVIGQALAEKLGLVMGPPAPLNGVAGIQLAATTTADLAFGGHATPAATLSVLPEEAIGGPGMLGLDRLDGDQLTLNFKEQSLRIDIATRNINDPREIHIKAHRRDGQLTLVDVDIARIPLLAFIDSGAQSTIGNMALRSMAISHSATTPWFTTPIISATGQTITAEMADLPHLRVGGFSLPSWPVAFADLHTFKMWSLVEKPAILIGVDLLSRFESVCLDFSRNEVRFRLPESMI